MNRQGKTIRVSPEVYQLLEPKLKSFRSWDALLRCAFGLPARKGEVPKLREVWIVDGSDKIFDRLAEARGEAIKLTALGGITPPLQPIKVREVL